MAKINPKRESLIEAASKLFLQQGVSSTTLAMIAQLAQVPLGNVYYYFKSKEAIVAAVIERRKAKIKGLVAQWNALATPAERLVAFILHGADAAENAVVDGDSLGNLCQELSKQGGDIAKEATCLMQELLSWAEEQYTLMGRTSEEAKNLSFSLLSSLHGLSMLSITFRSPDFIKSQVEYLKGTVAA